MNIKMKLLAISACTPLSINIAVAASQPVSSDRFQNVSVVIEQEVTATPKTLSYEQFKSLQATCEVTADNIGNNTTSTVPANNGVTTLTTTETVTTTK